MPGTHSDDKPFLPIETSTTEDSNPEISTTEDERDATFALPPDDPARVENRGGLEAVLENENRATDARPTIEAADNGDDGRSEYSSGRE